MQQTDIPRRTVLKGGAAAAVSGMTVMTVAGPAQAFPGHADEGVVIPWLDQPATGPAGARTTWGTRWCGRRSST